MVVSKIVVCCFGIKHVLAFVIDEGATTCRVTSPSLCLACGVYMLKLRPALDAPHCFYPVIILRTYEMRICCIEVHVCPTIVVYRVWLRSICNDMGVFWGFVCVLYQ